MTLKEPVIAREHSDRGNPEDRCRGEYVLSF